MFYSKQLDSYIKYLKRGNTAYLKCIFCVFSENSKKHRLLAAKTFAEYLSSRSADELWRAEKQMRDASSIEWSVDWRRYTLEKLLLPQMTAEQARAVTVFASFCANGYIREDAVKALVFHENSLPVIALRLGDWVSEVRESAETAFCARLPLASQDEIVSAFVLLEKSKGRRRSSSEKIGSAIEERLLCDKKLLRFALASRDVRARKFCIFLLCKNAGENRDILLSHIRREKDPFLRKTIFCSLLAVGMEKETLFPLMLEDKHPSNRLFAMATMPYGKEMQKLLFDENAAVRAFARSAASESEGGTDFLAIYKNALLTRTKCAILGIGDVGTKDDTAEIEPFLESPNAPICRAAAISLMRIDAEKYAPSITEKLLSKNESVFSTCAKLLKKYGFIDFKRINEIFLATENTQAKLRFLSLLFRATKWQKLIYILTYLHEEDAYVRNACEAALALWFEHFNRSYVAVTTEERETISGLIAGEETELRAKTEFFMGSK